MTTPATTSNSNRMHRHGARKPQDRETELRRERGEISCAECRRYVPCSTSLSLVSRESFRVNGTDQSFAFGAG